MFMYYKYRLTFELHIKHIKFSLPFLVSLIRVENKQKRSHFALRRPEVTNQTKYIGDKSATSMRNAHCL